MVYTIGCSGFHYKHWRGKFYPADLPVKKWFEFYSQHFNTLELNVTFYRFPKLKTLLEWHDGSPDNFSFSVKVPKAITHYKKLKDSARMIGDFYGLVGEGLREKLGGVLFQFPPNFSCTAEHIDRIIENLDPSFENVVEFRHSSWWNKEVIAQFGEKNIAFCGMSHPDFPDDVIANTSHLYYRMHGHEALYASDYSKNELLKIIDDIKQQKQVKRAYIYFNNDINGYATKDADIMIKAIAD